MEIVLQGGDTVGVVSYTVGNFVWALRTFCGQRIPETLMDGFVLLVEAFSEDTCRLTSKLPSIGLEVF